MDEKIRLLMEETGCDRGEAELALSGAGYDLERAIRTIPSLLKHIVALKARFRVPGANLYGLFLAIADTKRKKLFRVKAVASYNPSLYETDLVQDWFDFERKLYGFRLMEGAHPSVTKDLELLLDDLWSAQADIFLVLMQSKETDSLLQHLREFLERKLQWAGLQLELNREELNLAQFQQLRRDGAEIISPEPNRSFREGAFPLPLSVEVEFEGDPAGVPAAEIGPGDAIFSVITDDRDIAKYLSRLLGSRSGEEAAGLPTPVEGVERKGDSVKLSVRLTTGIVGRGEVPFSTRLKIQREVPSEGSWWRRLISWNKE